MNNIHKEAKASHAKSRQRWIIILALPAAIVALAVAGSTLNSVASGSWQQTELALSGRPVYRDSIEEISLTLSSSGFAPTDLSVQSNQFLLSLDNRTELKELVLRLSREDGSRVRELRVPGGGGDWSELFELPDGTYTLSEASHAEWSCTIRVRKR